MLLRLVLLPLLVLLARAFTADECAPEMPVQVMHDLIEKNVQDNYAATLADIEARLAAIESSGLVPANASDAVTPSCPWNTPMNDPLEFMCADGTIAHLSDDGGTACLSRGGKLKCPSSRPFMCEDDDHFGDYKCAATAQECIDSYGGLRFCGTPSPSPSPPAQTPAWVAVVDALNQTVTETQTKLSETEARLAQTEQDLAHALANISTLTAEMTSISTNAVGDFKVTVAEQHDHDGWLLCDGRVVNIADHPELYALVGNAYLQGQEPRLRASDSNWVQPANTFTIPDLRGRTLAGAGGGEGGVGNGVDEDGETIPARTIGEHVGSSNYSLAVENMPANTPVDTSALVMQFGSSSSGSYSSSSRPYYSGVAGYGGYRRPYYWSNSLMTSQPLGGSAKINGDGVPIPVRPPTVHAGHFFIYSSRRECDAKLEPVVQYCGQTQGCVDPSPGAACCTHLSEYVRSDCLRWDIVDDACGYRPSSAVNYLNVKCHGTSSKKKVGDSLGEDNDEDSILTGKVEERAAVGAAVPATD